MRVLVLVVVAGFMTFLPTRASVAQEAHGHGDLGHVRFPVSCSEASNQQFDRAVALLHHMMYVESRKAFEELALEDPGCAMAHWGVAMTLFQPLWPTRPSADDLRRGHQEVRLAMAGQLTERERAFAKAAEGFYREPESAQWSTRLARLEAGMAAVYQANPKDHEAGAFYALSHLATGSQSDKSRAHQTRAATILAEINAQEPTHPGAIHYTIHASDVDGRAGLGVDAARTYDDIAPSVPHALHMPTHIFVRLGEWNDVITWNRKSADAALKHPAGEYVSHHYPHAIDYLAYAYLQQAQDEKAHAVLDELQSKEPYQQSFVSAFHLAATPARYLVERRKWDEASSLVVRSPAAFPWERFAAAEAMTHFARGLGAARTGNAAVAREAASRLRALQDAETAKGESYWATQVEIKRLAVEAWVALADGNQETALELMTKSAALEASTEKHPVTPGALQPAFELLGDMLLETNQPDAALAAYRQSLEKWPRRFNSLLGAARAAHQAGQGEVARKYYGELIDLAGESTSREGIAEARRYAGEAGASG
ncbi:MAG: hypothetical protein HKM89_14110 [Gemmatimonadales bacterium]|nr:hypothetical protein [Gemmatimonadales bacterium]